MATPGEEAGSKKKIPKIHDSACVHALSSLPRPERFPSVFSDIIVGLTRQDISTTKGRHKDWGIFGLGELWGSACVVSSHRLIRKLGKKDLRRGLRRVVKVAIHEVGHVLGLPHCESPRCVMNDAKGTIKTVDLETGHLCEKCQAVLKSRFDYPDDHGFDVRWDAWLGP